MAVPISNVTRRQVYAPSGSGGAGPYSFTFEILANTDIAVYKDNTLLTLTTHYTVTINANGTGSVTITAAGLALSPTSPTQYAVVGNRTIARTSDFTTGGDFFANTLNDELDQQTIFAQQNAEGLQRALQAPQTDPTTINMTLPAKASRALKTLSFDSDGNPTPGVSASDVANAVTYATNAANSATAAASSASAASSSASSASGSASTASTQASNASTSASNASTSASGASTSATNAAASASTASTQASNASTSATNAASSASAASTSASNAATSATSAATAQTAAEAARDSALAAYDNFDDRYLGAKSSNPTLDNDGNALLAGALYFNTIVPEMRLWTGSAWVAAYVSGSGFVDLTSSQTIAGTKTFSSDTSIQGLTVGRGAGAVSTNTAVGASALAANTTGDRNAAFGNNALFSNQGGQYNVGLGDRTAYSNTSGSNLIAIGSAALYSNTTGANNVAIGRSALESNTTASNNTAVGYQAAYTNTTGTGLVAIGESALNKNTTGYNNIAIGQAAVYANTTGISNTGVGQTSIRFNTTGSYNTALGNSALYSNTTASYNTAVGYQALNAVTTADNNTAVGYQAGYQATGIENTLVGRSAGYTLTSGTANTFVGYGARGSSASASTQIVIGYDLTGQGNSHVTLGSSTGKIYNAFTVNATWTQTSDVRLKKNIQEETLGLSFINRLRPVKFTWKPSNELEQDNPYYAEENKRDTTTVIHGLIAQEVKAALDAEGVDTFAGWDMGSDGIQAISREMFISPLIKAIQELKAEVDSLKAQINGASA